MGAPASGAALTEQLAPPLSLPIPKTGQSARTCSDVLLIWVRELLALIDSTLQSIIIS